MRPKLVNILEFQKLFPKSAGASHNIFTIKDFTQKNSEYFKISKCLQAFPKSAGVPHNLFTIKNFTTKISECSKNSKPLAQICGSLPYFYNKTKLQKKLVNVLQNPRYVKLYG